MDQAEKIAELIAALSEANNENTMLKAQCDGANSLLLDCQQDCIKLQSENDTVKERLRRIARGNGKVSIVDMLTGDFTAADFLDLIEAKEALDQSEAAYEREEEQG